MRKLYYIPRCANLIGVCSATGECSIVFCQILSSEIVTLLSDDNNDDHNDDNDYYDDDDELPLADFSRN